MDGDTGQEQERGDSRGAPSPSPLPVTGLPSAVCSPLSVSPHVLGSPIPVGPWPLSTLSLLLSVLHSIAPQCDRNVNLCLAASQGSWGENCLCFSRLLPDAVSCFPASTPTPASASSDARSSPHSSPPIFPQPQKTPGASPHRAAGHTAPPPGTSLPQLFPRLAPPHLQTRRPVGPFSGTFSLPSWHLPFFVSTHLGTFLLAVYRLSPTVSSCGQAQLCLPRALARRLPPCSCVVPASERVAF